ncbi:MAG TPA: YetF domain-containing protein [Vicinamibacterales bacterium]|nr:YetF domain-containing protein [Vicinamibacterales bacterium]
MDFFSSWSNLGQVLVTGLAAYVGLVTLLRFSGKRTLTKLNAFDLVVTVALGSTLASVILPQDSALADGLLALAVLVGAQFAVAWLQVRAAGFRGLVKSQPALLFYRGEFLPEALQRERVASDEVLSAVRSSGIAQLDDIEAVVLETDGSMSVVQRASGPESRSSLAGVRGVPKHRPAAENDTRKT